MSQALSSTNAVPELVSSGVTSALPTTSSFDAFAFLNPITPDTFANGFATLCGAMLGAMFAYLFQRRLQRSQEHRVSLIAAHRVMFSLLQQLNTVLLVQRDHVFDELKNRGRFLSIPALPPFDIKKNTLELSELAFLLEDVEGRKFLYDFYIAQENYVEALNQWNLRSAFHIERLQPNLAASGISNGTVVTNETIRKALGEHVYGQAVNSTDNCIAALSRAYEKLWAVKVSIRPYLVRRFRTNDFTDFDFPDTWGLTDPEAQQS